MRNQGPIERVFVLCEEYDIETHADGVEYLRVVEVIRDESGVMHSEELIEEVPLREWVAAGGVLPAGVWRDDHR